MEIGESVPRQEDIYIIQTGWGKINNNLLEHLIMINVSNIVADNYVTAFVPHFP